MCEELLKLARRTAAHAAGRFRNNPLTGDIYSAAYLGAVEGSTALGCPTTEPERTAYIVKAIQYQVNACISDSSLIRIPHRSRKRLVAEGRPLPSAVVLEAGTDVPDRAPPITIEDTGLEGEDRLIIELLMDGHTKSEIAEHLGISRKALWRRQQRIREKCCDLL
jgi:hypothetical protein